MDLSELKNLKAKALEEIKQADSKEAINALKGKFLGKSSILNEFMQQMRTLSQEDKSIFGKEINDVRTGISTEIDQKIKAIEEEKITKSLNEDSIDMSLTGRGISLGGTNPFYKIIDEACEIFVSMGFKVEEGSEIESDHYNFELLNIPKDHPARDMQDTFYFDPNKLLRTHTSPIQAHVLESNPNSPIRIICPGKTYRRDDDDATHSHQFAQIEGLVVDKGVSMANLKATLELFIKAMFGEKREIRFRSSYFPFTEPSVEVDVSCAECNGKGCSVCKGTGYIEILGAGMVHPNVLKMAGYDPEVYSGFAFGAGIERIAMLRYGINDIRKFYTNDLRFLKQFNKRK